MSPSRLNPSSGGHNTSRGRRLYLQRKFTKVDYVSVYERRSFFGNDQPVGPVARDHRTTRLIGCLHHAASTALRILFYPAVRQKTTARRFGVRSKRPLAGKTSTTQYRSLRASNGVHSSADCDLQVSNRMQMRRGSQQQQQPTSRDAIA